jgi:hypothetical protein
MIARYHRRDVFLSDTLVERADSLADNRGWWFKRFRYQKFDAAPPTVQQIKHILASQKFGYLPDGKLGAMAIRIRKTFKRGQAARRRELAKLDGSARMDIVKAKEKQRQQEEAFVRSMGGEIDKSGQIVKARLVGEIPTPKKRFGQLR